MQTDNRLLDDIARLANSMLGMAAGARAEMEAAFKTRLQSLLADQNLVSREAFEVVAAMAAKARAEQEALSEKVTALEARLAALEAQKR
jgi:hypothetical protein